MEEGQEKGKEDWKEMGFPWIKNYKYILVDIKYLPGETYIFKLRTFPLLFGFDLPLLIIKKTFSENH